MKNFIVFILVFLFGVTMVVAQGPKRPKAKAMKPIMAYEAEYSSNFSIADDTYSARVLELWKDFEDNDFERNRDYFTEDLVMALSNGEILNGRELIINSAKEYRKSIKDYKPTLVSYISLRSDDKDENWVAVWGEDSFTDEQGNTVKTDVHEIWRFNKEGKIDFMKQYVVTPKN